MCYCLDVFFKTSRRQTKNIILLDNPVKSHGECSICLENMIYKTEALPCGHLFHVHCIRTWLKRQRVCPICASRL